MSGSKFDEAIAALRAPLDQRALTKVLVTLRKEVEWPGNEENISKLRASGSLRTLVKMLTTGRGTMDIVLSILGNCIMNKGCARDVIGLHNILNPLNQALKRYPEEDSINGRIFRIIGNLCCHKEQWANVIIERKPTIITHIIDVISTASEDDPSNKFSDATVNMALRALRILVNSRTIIPLVKSFKVPKVIGNLFIKLSMEYQDNRNHHNLLNSILRLLYEYSIYKCYDTIIQMRSTARGDSLLYLSNVLLLSPKKIVKIIMNFIRICQLRSELPIPEICDKLIDEILKYLNTKEIHGDCTECIHCLCFMLEEPANRNIERCGKCLPLLIKIVEELEDPNNDELELCALIFITLSKCTYDEALIKKQLECNIINVIMKKLHWLVKDSDFISKKHVKKFQSESGNCLITMQLYVEEDLPQYGKRRKYHDTEVVNSTFPNFTELLSPQQSPSRHGYGPRQYSPCSSDDEYLNRSPSPCSSTDSYPSCSSPRSFRANATDSDSDDYSPVCSEADPDEENIDCETNVEDVKTEVEDEKLAEEDTFSRPDDSTKAIKVRIVSEMMNLLRRFSKLKPSVPQLGSEDLIIALLKCSRTLCPSLEYCVVETISKILESPDYLIPLMKNKFVETFYDLSKVQHLWCSTCFYQSLISKFVLKKLSNLAESEVGKGDIAHQLLRGNKDVKEQMVLVIPYIIRNKSLLAKYMLKCGGLSTMMQLLRQGTSWSLKERTCKVLSALASKNLEITNPKLVGFFSKREIIKVKEYELGNNCSNVVTFLLDDGSSLRADREFLCEKSDFFCGLLNGHFKEREQTEITLPNVQSRSLRCLLYLLKSVDTSFELDIKVDLDTLLDVIVLSDRYLMGDLCQCLTSTVQKFMLSTKTVPAIYRWSLDSKTNFLRVESIAYALVVDVESKERHKMFRKLLDLEYSNELLEDIHNLLIRYLSSFVR